MITQMNVGQTRLVFGANAIGLIVEELKKMRLVCPLIVTDKMLNEIGLLELLTDTLREAKISFEVFDEVTPDPNGSVVDKAVSFLKEKQCDSVIGFGGGSVMDTAKCVAAMATNNGVLMDYDHANLQYREFVEISLPLINIPTTSGTGSEMSPYAVITNEQQGRKATIGSPSLLSRVALVDPMLVLNLPKRVTAATGADALTHCIESYTTRKSMESPNPIIDALALTAIRYLYEYLPIAYQNGCNYEAREKIMWGSVIGGIVLQYGSGASHGLGNVLGGEYHVPHGAAVGILLPYVMAFNQDVCKERYQQIADKLGLADDKALINGVADLMKKIRMPGLSDYLKDTSDIERLAKIAVTDKCSRINGKELNIGDAKSIYKKAL